MTHGRWPMAHDYLYYPCKALRDMTSQCVPHHCVAHVVSHVHKMAHFSLEAVQHADRQAASNQAYNASTSKAAMLMLAESHSKHSCSSSSRKKHWKTLLRSKLALHCW